MDMDNWPFEELEAEEVVDQHYDVLKELADCHAALGDIHLAREYYRRAMALAPNEAAPHVGLGTIAIQTGRLEEAEASFRAALKTSPDCAEAYGGLAMAAQHRRDYDTAFEMYLRCLELDADNLVALLGLFQTSCQMGSFAKIIHYLELYLDKHPGDTSVLFCLATLYARQGRLTDARESLLALLSLEPDKNEAADLLEEVRLASAAVTAGVDG
jgi:tetratricopeptide (TPR) repeat protein